MLKFSNANAKTEALKQVPELAEYLKDKRKIYSLDLLSGYSCPYAEKCLSKATVDITTGKRKIQSSVVFRLVKKCNIITYIIYANTIMIR